MTTFGSTYFLPADVLGSEWIGGDNLWRVGFHIGALPLVPILSGLVEVLMTVYESQERALVFIVRSLDKTGVLFNDGLLKANRIHRYRQIDQTLEVQSDVTQSSAPFKA